MSDSGNSSSSATNNHSTWIGWLALIWGGGGFLALLLYAVLRLTPIFLDSVTYQWDAIHWLGLIVNLVFMAWSEGYRGFQSSYSPRFAARLHYLFHHASLRQALLAPAVGMAFIDAPRKRIIGAWLLTFAVVVVVMVYRTLPQPWRGILDAGVVLGLAWGMMATVYFVVLALNSGPLVDPEMRVIQAGGDPESG